MDNSGRYDQTTAKTAQNDENVEEAEVEDTAEAATRIMHPTITSRIHYRPLYQMKASSVTARPMVPTKLKARRVGRPPQKERRTRRMMMLRSASFARHQSYTKLCLRAITGPVIFVP